MKAWVMRDMTPSTSTTVQSRPVFQENILNDAPARTPTLHIGREGFSSPPSVAKTSRIPRQSAHVSSVLLRPPPQKRRKQQQPQQQKEDSVVPEQGDSDEQYGLGIF